MKKILNILITGICFVIMTGACVDDEGNYDYKLLNTIEISGIGQVYQVDQMDTLKIETLQLGFKLGETKDLDFEWKVNGQVVSTERFCRAVITEKPDGAKNYPGVLCITDNSNGLKYYAQFEVKVGTAFTNALYLLSEAEDGTAFLSMQRRDRENAPVVTRIFEQLNPDFGHLGKSPRQVISSREYVMETGGSHYDPIFYVVCAEGDKKVSTLDPQTMELQNYYTADMIGEGYQGDFTPEYFSCYGGDGLVISEGKLFMLNYNRSRSLYRPVTGYSFAWVGQTGGGWYGYDEASDRFLSLDKGDDPVLLDKVVPLNELEFAQSDPLETSGLKYLAAAENNDVLYPVLWDPQSKTAHFYEIFYEESMDFDMSIFDWVITKSLTFREIMQRPNVYGEKPVCLLDNQGYWFFAKGNKIVRFINRDGGNVTDWYTDLTGDVTTMIFDNSKERILVATWDGSQSRIYELSTLEARKSLTTPLILKEKVVSMCVTGKWLTDPEK